jgi:radical SAM superfamily enzyme YgiQ (UPF0313 family)
MMKQRRSGDDPMNILLVSPQTPDTFWSFRHVLPFVGKKAAFPPLGLLTIAAMLPDTWWIKLVDLNVTKLTDSDIDWADAVFVSAMIVHEESARRIIARSNERDVPVVAGGPLFTTAAERFPEMACCVVGEAEEVMLELANDMAAGTLKRRYQAAERPDVTKTPIPRWDLINVRDYATMSLQFSRGCPFDCEFCDITAVYGRKPRTKTPEQMIGELEALLATGWNGSIFIVDDNFIGNKVKSKAMLRAIIDWQRERGVCVNFITEASINLVDDPELLDLMVQAGFKKVFVGIESPQEKSLKECRKVQNTNRDLVDAVRTIHHAGIQVMGGFIVGFDNDTPGIFEQQRRFIQESGVVTAMVGMLTALPGTRLFTRLTAEGRMVGQSTGNNLDATLNFIPTLDRTTLTEGYRRLVKDIYSPREYYQRILTFLREYRPTGRPARLVFSDMRAFLSSLWIMGVATPGRREYWTFLMKALLRHRRAFAEAVELAIMGHHFRAIARGL